MKKLFAFIGLSVLLIMSALAQDVTLPGSASCNGAAVAGTWTVPCNVTSITVEVYGGGGGAGGGGGGSNGGFFNTRGGGGGGGGGFASVTISVVPGSAFSYSIGSGGCGGSNGSDGSSGGNGTAGNGSSFTGTAQGGGPVNLIANGGARGTGGSGTAGSTGSGGAGGTASGGLTNTTGTAGANGSGATGGSGGAGAGTAGGAGGATTGANGNANGGGGAGGGDSQGGQGAAGAILITYNTTIAVPVTPLVSGTPATCTVDGSSVISNYDAGTTYTFTPAGPSAGAGGLISGMINGTSYTVVAGSGACATAPSASFSNAAATGIPAVPVIVSAPATCSSDGSSTISNYNAAVTYLFTPAGPAVSAGGVITGMITATGYTVVASDGTCSSSSSASFSNDVQLTVPVGSVSGQLSYCLGSNTTLTASGGAGYIWADAGANIIGNSAAVTVTQGTYAVLITAANGCSDTVISTVTEIATLPVSITGVLTYCPSLNTTITANGGTGYVWNDASSSTTAGITVTQGTYSVTGTDANGCTGTASATVTLLPTPVINISGPLSYCAGANTTLTASGAAGYVWSDAGNSTMAAISVMQGNYTVTGTDANGCTATTSASVTENVLPAVSISGLLSYCTGGNTILTASGGNSYVWSTGATTAAVTLTQGSYTVTATDANGCTGSSTAVVTESSSLSVVINGDLTYCTGANTVLTAGGGTTYTWSNGSTGAGITVTQGTYTVTATDVTCTGTASAVVSEIATTPINLGGNVTACDDSIIVLDAGAGYPVYTWSTGDTTQTVAAQTSGAYSVTVLDANSCTVSSSVNVVLNPCNVPENNLFIPTAFSPNGDGANDLFRLKPVGALKRYTLLIYNRWGEKVFESNDVADSWDGVYDGKAQPMGNYVWHVEYTFMDESRHKKSGNVTLVK